jgi:hypothetical protein
MHLEQLRSSFERRQQRGNFVYSIQAAASIEDISNAQKRLSVEFPSQVKMFYQCANGLRVDDPPLEIFPLDRLHRTSSTLVQFATLDGRHQLVFDTSHLNEAGQWSILGANGFHVTLTMASFWSNKIWAWLDKRRKIWQDEWPDAVDRPEL